MRTQTFAICNIKQYYPYYNRILFFILIYYRRRAVSVPSSSFEPQDSTHLQYLSLVIGTWLSFRLQCPLLQRYFALNKWLSPLTYKVSDWIISQFFLISSLVCMNYLICGQKITYSGSPSVILSFLISWNYFHIKYENLESWLCLNWPFIMAVIRSKLPLYSSQSTIHVKPCCVYMISYKKINYNYFLLYFLFFCFIVLLLIYIRW